MGDVPVLLHCSLLRNSRPKPTGVLEHCPEGEINIDSQFGGVPFPNVTKNVNVKNFHHTAIPVNYTSEFREIFEATT